MEKFISYLRNVRDELVNKVSWPTWDELRESTIIVMVSSLIFSVLVWAMDQGLGWTLTKFYAMF